MSVINRNLSVFALLSYWILFVCVLRTNFVAAAVAETPSHPFGNDDAIQMGTTLVAIRHRSGVVVGADSRTSVSGYVSHRFAHKISPITDNVVILRSGSAADTQHLAREASATFLSRSYRYTDSSATSSVQQVANWLASRVYGNEGLQVSLIVAGYDSDLQKGRIFSIATSGVLFEENEFAVSGSGSTYALGYLDQKVPKGASELLSEEEATEICGKALELAMDRDGSSGGGSTMFSITAEGQGPIISSPAASKKERTGAEECLPGFANPVVVVPRKKYP